MCFLGAVVQLGQCVVTRFFFSFFKNEKQLSQHFWCMPVINSISFIKELSCFSIFGTTVTILSFIKWVCYILEELLFVSLWWEGHVSFSDAFVCFPLSFPSSSFLSSLPTSLPSHFDVVGTKEQELFDWVPDCLVWLWLLRLLLTFLSLVFCI